MFILKKKQILFIEFSIIISFLYTLFCSDKIQLEKSLQVSSTPVAEHTIVLDAGHGIPDSGAQNEEGISEAEINLSIVQKLQYLLESSNCNVVLTRSDENGIYDLDKKSIRDKKVSDMKNRVSIGNDSENELFISIHLNKINDGRYYGWQTFYQKNSEEGKILSELIQENLNQTIQIQNKRMAQSITRKIYN